MSLHSDNKVVVLHCPTQVVRGSGTKVHLAPLMRPVTGTTQPLQLHDCAIARQILVANKGHDTMKELSMTNHHGVLTSCRAGSLSADVACQALMILSGQPSWSRPAAAKLRRPHVVIEVRSGHCVMQIPLRVTN